MSHSRVATENTSSLQVREKPRQHSPSCKINRIFHGGDRCRTEEKAGSANYSMA